METILILIIFGIGLISYEGFRNHQFLNKYIFDVDRILITKEYYRLFSSGFLHSGWLHLIFNMIALSSFGRHIIFVYGIGSFGLIYLSSLIGGSLLSLYVHRNHGSYRALGASGAIFGIVFSSIVIEPLGNHTFILLPMEVPAWLMGSLFVGVSIWGIKKSNDNIGHEAHLGGAVIGMLITAIIDTRLLTGQFWIFALLMLPSIAFIAYILKNPSYLIVEKISIPQFKKKAQKHVSLLSREERLNQLLDKINDQGIESLSETEQQQLSELSGESED